MTDPRLDIIAERLGLSDIPHRKAPRYPTEAELFRLLSLYRAVMFPRLCSYGYGGSSLAVLHRLLTRTLDGLSVDDATEQAYATVSFLPEIRTVLLSDAEATYRNDPAAVSVEEVLLAYPGFYAISVHRLAHLMYLSHIPYLPRALSEYAHSRTGIDIHPGASIGPRFCIDHGTGIVIGETAEIGADVRIYHSVTLGAKWLETDCEGNPVRGIKRHPTVGNGCVIYAGARIFGGDTVLGDGCIVGSGVLLTHSLAPGEIVLENKK